jgi:hypothetical protein
MYARMDRASGQHGVPESRSGLMAFSSTTPGLLGSIALGQLAGPAEVHLTFWDTQASAAGFPGPRSQAAGLPGLVYEVADAREGPAAAYPPSHALLPYFDGPRLPELTAAADRAWRQRLWPGIRGVDGLVACYVLHHDDLGTVIVHLGTTLEALEAIGRAVRSSELLPGEDPALLPGPDRIELHHVTGYRAPVARPAATSKGR